MNGNEGKYYYEAAPYTPKINLTNPVDGTIYDDGVCDNFIYLAQSGTCHKKVTKAEPMFLLSEYGLKQMKYESAYDNDDNDGQTYPSDWRYSDAWSWCNNTSDSSSFISASFTSDEKNHLLKTSKDNTCAPYTDELKGDTFFFLSRGEFESDYIKNDIYAKLSSSSGIDVRWWLRFPEDTNVVDCVIKPGDRNGDDDICGGADVTTTLTAACPAFNLNQSSVLFTSPAEGGKEVNVGTLTKNADNSGSEYKLTMNDDSRKFAIVEKSAKCNKGEKLEFNYSNAKIGDNEYISATLLKNDKVTYYGQLAKPTSESGKVELELPSGLTLGTYELRLFNEQINGDSKTDLSSDFVKINLRVVNEKSITLGTTVFSGYDSTNGYDCIYYGEYDGKPIKWRILSMKGNGEAYYEAAPYTPTQAPTDPEDGKVYTDSDETTKFIYLAKGDTYYKQTKSTPMFLLSEYALEQMAYDDNTANKGQKYVSDWRYSDAWSWCNNTTDTDSFISESFTSVEKNHLLKTSKSNSSTGSCTDELKGDTFFFLSLDEAKSDYIVNDRVAELITGGSIRWWLRSPKNDLQPNLVKSDGGIGYSNVTYSYAARPAFNLDSSSVLFTTAAEGGKTVKVGTLTKNADNSVRDYKLTVKDDSRKFAIAEKTVKCKKGGKLEFNYSNAEIGDNEYISAILVNSGRAWYYGQLARSTAESGRVELELPTDIDFGTYELRLFNEQINGDRKTDYSSDFISVELAVGLEGEGTSEKPYLIHDLDELEYFRDMVNSGSTGICGRLTEDIAVNSGTFDKYGSYTPANGEACRKWKPIGIATTVPSIDTSTGTQTQKEVYTEYIGTFDGNGKTISGLYLNDDDFNYAGLFGLVGGGATIKNLGIKNSYFKGNNCVGGIVGRISASGEHGVTVEGCFNEGSICGKSNVGGIAGSASASGGSAVTLVRCRNAGSIYGKYFTEAESENLGGIVGYAGVRAVVTKIEKPDFSSIGTSTGTIPMKTTIKSDGTALTISDCYNTASVEKHTEPLLGSLSGANFGGIVGNAELVYTAEDKSLSGIPTDGVRELTVSHCYNIGSIDKVKNADEIAGCTVYYNENFLAVSRDDPLTTIIECYYPDDSATAGDLDTVVGKSTDAFASGEVAYLLCGNRTDSAWGQNIGTEKYPSFSNARVYEDEYNGIKARRNEIVGNKILMLGADKKSATVVLEKAGAYAVVFADYDGDRLANVKSFKVTIAAPQAVRVASDESFTLGTGDKIMLWDDFVSLTPLCDAYEVK